MAENRLAHGARGVLHHYSSSSLASQFAANTFDPNYYSTDTVSYEARLSDLGADFG